MLFNKITIGSTLLIILGLVIKYNSSKNNSSKNDFRKSNITKLDKTTSVSNLKNININTTEVQTLVSLDKTDTFLIKETYINNTNKWYDIIDEIKY